MSFRDEHPDRDFERRQELADELDSQERRMELRARHSPARREVISRPTSAMSALAYSVLHSEERDARGAARALAQLVLDQAEAP